jgi:hypothetical protein
MSPRIVTSTFVSYEADSSSRNVSLVVNAIDEFLNEPPRAALRVVLKETPRRTPVTNASGHYVFLDIADGGYTLLVEPDPVNADWYFLRPTANERWRTGFERRITLPKANSLAPVENVVLTPKPGYPFPAETTLVLGRVTRGTETGTPVALAVVKTSYERVRQDDPDKTERVNLETATDRNGYFVLFFHSLPTNAQDIEVAAEAGGSTVRKTVSITERETTTTTLVFP